MLEVQKLSIVCHIIAIVIDVSFLLLILHCYCSVNIVINQ